MENSQDDLDSEDPSDERKIKIVRAVLLFAAIVIAGVSIYTTFLLFSVSEIDISFSPPEAAQFSPPVEEGIRATGSFDIQQEKTDESGTTVYEDKEIEPAPIDGSAAPIHPLIINEDLGEGSGNLVFVLIILELVLIGLIYWVVDRQIVGRRKT